MRDILGDLLVAIGAPEAIRIVRQCPRCIGNGRFHHWAERTGKGVRATCCNCGHVWKVRYIASEWKNEE